MRRGQYLWLIILSFPNLFVEIGGLNGCHFSPDICNERDKCDIKETAKCCHVTKVSYLQKALTELRTVNIKYMYLYNITTDVLNITNAGNYLEALVITGGNIKKIIGLSNFPNLKCLNVSNNGVSYIGHINSTKLEILDMSHNNLSNLPVLAFDSDTRNLAIDLSGNSRMLCRSVAEFINNMAEKKHVEVNNKNSTICDLRNSFMWFNSSDKITYHDYEDIRQGETACERIEGLKKCHCKVHRLLFDPFKPLLLVNCSGLHLKSLPPILPVGTDLLDVSNNNITNLEEIRGDTYKDIKSFYADNNPISTITTLEGTVLIENIFILSLRSTNITTVPTYFFSNTFHRNYGSIVLLGGNKLNCGCDIVTFQGWLMSNKQFVTDYDKVKCNNIAKAVVDLNPKDVCFTTKSWTDYIYYIIAAEVALLIFLIGKVSYDYWVFKTAGYLPWPASKMPKLPCDWVLEILSRG